MIELMNNPFIQFSDGKFYIVSYGTPIIYDIENVTVSDRFTIPSNGTIFMTKTTESADGYVSLRNKDGNVVLKWINMTRFQLNKINVFKNQIISFRTHKTDNASGTRYFKGMKVYFCPYSIKPFNSFTEGNIINITPQQNFIYEAPSDGILKIQSNSTSCNMKIYKDTHESPVASDSYNYIAISSLLRKHEPCYINLSTTNNMVIHFIQYEFA